MFSSETLHFTYISTSITSIYPRKIEKEISNPPNLLSKFPNPSLHICTSMSSFPQKMKKIYPLCLSICHQLDLLRAGFSISAAEFKIPPTLRHPPGDNICPERFVRSADLVANHHAPTYHFSFDSDLRNATSFPSFISCLFRNKASRPTTTFDGLVLWRSLAVATACYKVFGDDISTPIYYNMPPDPVESSPLHLELAALSLKRKKSRHSSCELANLDMPDEQSSKAYWPGRFCRTTGEPANRSEHGRYMYFILGGRS